MHDIRNRKVNTNNLSLFTRLSVFILTTLGLRQQINSISIQGRNPKKSHSCPIYTNVSIRKFRWSIGTTGPNRKLCHSNGSIGVKQVRCQTKTIIIIHIIIVIIIINIIIIYYYLYSRFFMPTTNETPTEFVCEYRKTLSRVGSKIWNERQHH